MGSEELDGCAEEGEMRVLVVQYVLDDRKGKGG